MKASIINHKRLRAWSLALAVVLAAGCSDDKKGDGNGSVDGVVAIQSIIVNPKATEPEDTVNVTAALEGVATPGEFPVVRWSKTGGDFITDNEQSVDWIAPETPGVYRLTCRATSGQSSAEMFVDVFVGEPTLSVNQNGGEIRLRPTQGEFYYLNSVPLEEAWDSSKVYIQETGVPEPVVQGPRVGTQFAYTNDLSRAAYVVNSAGRRYGLDPVDVFVIDLLAGTERKITSDGAASTSDRRHRHTHPYFSPDGNWITYQVFQPNPQSGNIDTVDVFVYDLQTDEETNVTAADTVSNERSNLFPTYSTDSNWLVFVSDKQQRPNWDLFGNKLDAGGAIADTTVKLTTGGLVGLGSRLQLGTPLLEWNPTQPLLALVGGGGSDGGLHLVTVTADGANVAAVADVGTRVTEIAWSGNGQVLAVSALVDALSGEGVDNAVFTVTPGGTASLRHRAGADERVADLGWSSDGKFLVFRKVRRFESWIELLDVDGGTNLAAPLPLTRAASDGQRVTYAAEMSTAVRFGSGGIVYFALFDTAITPQGSPTIWTLDVSSVVQP